MVVFLFFFFFIIRIKIRGFDQQRTRSKQTRTRAKDLQFGITQGRNSKVSSLSKRVRFQPLSQMHLKLNG